MELTFVVGFVVGRVELGGVREREWKGQLRLKLETSTRVPSNSFFSFLSIPSTKLVKSFFAPASITAMSFSHVLLQKGNLRQSPCPASFYSRPGPAGHGLIDLFQDGRLDSRVCTSRAAWPCLRPRLVRDWTRAAADGGRGSPRARPGA